MLKFGLVDEVIPEPPGGAHWDYDLAASHVKAYLNKNLQELQAQSAQARIQARIAKYSQMGFWEEA